MCNTLLTAQNVDIFKVEDDSAMAQCGIDEERESKLIPYLAHIACFGRREIEKEIRSRVGKVKSEKKRCAQTK